MTGRAWDLAVLDGAATERRTEIDAQVADSEEVRAVVQGLEQQYDAFQRAAGNSLLAQEDELSAEDLPTGDELGEQFEQFLAGLDKDD